MDFFASFLEHLTTNQIWALIQGTLLVIWLIVAFYQSVEIGWNGKHPVLRLKKKEGMAPED